MYNIDANTNIKQKNIIKPDDNILSIQKIMEHIPNPYNKQLKDRIFLFDTLESTNKTAKEMALSVAGNINSHHSETGNINAVCNTVIIANHQSAGKGTHGKSFFSPKNHGLYISFILDSKKIPLNDVALITVSAGVSVCEAIEALCDKKPKIKWVNDIFLENKKICGILTESVIGAESHNQPFIIQGIGINFSTPASDFPIELQKVAGSLFEENPAQITRNRLTAEIINRILFPVSERPKEQIENQIREKYNHRQYNKNEGI